MYIKNIVLCNTRYYINIAEVISIPYRIRNREGIKFLKKYEVVALLSKIDCNVN